VLCHNSIDILQISTCLQNPQDGNLLFDVHCHNSVDSLEIPTCFRNPQDGNPLFDNNTLLDTVDSLGGERNPLFDSTSGQHIADERSQRNLLFGTNILDSLQGPDHPKSRWVPLNIQFHILN